MGVRSENDRRLIVFCLCVGILCLSLAFLQGGVSGCLGRLVGPAEITRFDKKGTVRNGKVSRAISLGDIVVTAEEKARLILRDGRVIEIAPHSTVEFSRGRREAFDVWVRAGSVDAPPGMVPLRSEPPPSLAGIVPMPFHRLPSASR